ncbi:MAG TPA: hypothetical protein VF717_05960 [Pyrinomonadaceae bacterium]|jgi:hypothetical protein
MKTNFKPSRIILSVTLSFLFTVPNTSQTVFPSQTPLLEFVSFYGIMGGRQYTTRVYSDGRYIFEALEYEKAKSGKLRKVITKSEKQLEPDEVAELISLAEQPDFLQAQSEYVTIVQDNGSHTTITYSNKGREKKVMVSNYNAGSSEAKAKIPASVMKLLRWANPYGFD